jgi:hypothetical protein
MRPGVASLLLLSSLPLLGSCPTPRLEVRGQLVPTRAAVTRPTDFQVGADVVAMHYYGAGGWLLKWRGQVLLLGPYFSNHAAPKVVSTQALRPLQAAIERGVAGSPIKDATWTSTTPATWAGSSRAATCRRARWGSWPTRRR